MNKETYSKPIVEINKFKAFDVITISDPKEPEIGDGGNEGTDFFSLR